MTISSATNKSGPYTENGVTDTFAYAFKIEDETHVKVVRAASGVETVLTLTTDYTVTGVGDDAGGNVVINTPVSGSTLTLVLDVPFTQETDFQNQGAFFAEVVEAALDLAAQRDKQLQEQINRAVVVPVSADVADLDTLVSGILALEPIAANITTVAGISGNVTTVAGIAANVTTVAGISANVVTVAGIAADVTAVAADAADIGTVAGAIANVTTVAGIAANVTTVAGIAANVTAVAGNATNINAVAGNATNINAVVANATNINAVAANATNVNTVATNIASVNSAATNMAAIIAAPTEAANAAQSAIDAAASAASVDVTSMDFRRNLSVNGSLLSSQENGDTLGTANGYFYACQKALYRSADLAGKISAQRVTHTSLEGGSKAGEFKCVSTATVGATSLATDTEFIEGSDPLFVAAGWGAAGAKSFVYRKEVQKPAGTYSFHFSNRAGNRHMWIQYVIAPGDANTKVVVEVVVPGDTGGTWSKADGEIGLVIDDVFVLGTNYIGGTEGVWSGTNYQGGAGQKNFLDNTANTARHTDFGLRIDPDATGVYGQYEVGEVHPVYRSENYYRKLTSIAFDGICSGGMRTSTEFNGVLAHAGMRKPPALQVSAVSDFFAVTASGNSASSAISSANINTETSRITATVAVATAGYAGTLIFASAGKWLALNARLS